MSDDFLKESRTPTKPSGFEFIVGRWRVRNRRRESYIPSANDDWLEFDSLVEGCSILAQRGYFDCYTFPFLAAESGFFHGLCLRLVDDHNRWRIWWASSTTDGALDSPLIGGFDDGEGHFAGCDTYLGESVQVSTSYTDITPESFRWEQRFSFDLGASFIPNWTMEFERER